MFKLVIDIVRFKRGPQDMASSRNTVTFCAAIYAISGFLALRLLDVDQAVGVVVFDIVVLSVFIYVALSVRKLLNRFNQTLATMLATGTLINIVYVPVALLLIGAAEKEQPNPIFVLIYIAIIAWSISVGGHIFSHALEINKLKGVMLSFVLFVLSQMMVNSVFEESNTTSESIAQVQLYR